MIFRLATTVRRAAGVGFLVASMAAAAAAPVSAQNAAAGLRAIDEASRPAPMATDLAVRADGRASHVVAGGVAGFVIGAGATWIVLHRGGSTSLCDRAANQDAINARECAAITVLGGVAGAAIGALIGSRIRRGRASDDMLRFGVAPGGRLHAGVRLAR